MRITKSKTLKRIATDAELREHVAGTLQDLQRIAKESSPGQKSPAAGKETEKVTGEVVEDAPETGKGKCRHHRLRKLVVLAVIGAVVALVVSEDARKLALDALFGAEDEFEYSSNATTARSGSNGAV